MRANCEPHCNADEPEGCCPARSWTGVSNVVFTALTDQRQADRKAGCYKSRFRTGRFGAAFLIKTGVIALATLYAFDCRVHSRR